MLVELILQDTAGIPPRLEKAMEEKKLPMLLRETIIASICAAYCTAPKSDPAMARILDAQLPPFIDNANGDVLRLIAGQLSYSAVIGKENKNYKRPYPVKKTTRESLANARDRMRMTKDDSAINDLASLLKILDTIPLSAK